MLCDFRMNIRTDGSFFTHNVFFTRNVVIALYLIIAKIEFAVTCSSKSSKPPISLVIHVTSVRKVVELTPVSMSSSTTAT